MSTSAPPWVDAVFAHQDLGPLVVQWLDVATLLALRRTCRGGKQAADREFSLVKARRRVRMWARTPSRRRQEGQCLMTNLARLGKLRLVQWARCGERVAWDEYATAWAAFHGHVHVIQWMCFEADPPMPYAKHAAPQGEYHDVGAVGVECKYAAKAGRLDVIEWLRARDFALTNEAIHEAVREGHLHVVKRLCCIADPYATWLTFLIEQIAREKFMAAIDGSATEDYEDHEEEEEEEEDASFARYSFARYKERIRPWLPILEWYMPFATVTERRKLSYWVPLQWFRP